MMLRLGVSRSFGSCLRRGQASRGISVGTSRLQEDQPDIKTSVNVHEHKLTRPTAPPGTAQKKTTKWVGLEGLSTRTRESLIPDTLKEMEESEELQMTAANLKKMGQESLIPDTLKEMEESEEFQVTAANLKKMGQAKLTRQERLQRQRSLDDIGVPDFLEFWKFKKKEKGLKVPKGPMRKGPIEIMQLNVGLYCNQACTHCHVESSPRRQEMMEREVADRCLEILKNSPTVGTLDLTGGAPELCSQFRHLAAGGRALGKKVIVRTNLTALLEPGQEDTAQFFKDQGLSVNASLPCYSAKNVNTQRGKGVFDKSIHALLILNELGFGKPDSGLTLDLVYNPLGGFLPPPQGPLEEKYKEELMEVFGIEFNNLFTVTNMPIKKFNDFLYRRNELTEYMELLVQNYNLDTVDRMMCGNILNIGWTGHVFDCDFNQQLELPIKHPDSQKPRTVFDIESCDELRRSVIELDNHCYGCSAGMGSS